MNSLKIRKSITHDIILNFDNKISPELQILNSVKKNFKDFSEVNRFIKINFPNGIQSVLLHLAN